MCESLHATEIISMMNLKLNVPMCCFVEVWQKCFIYSINHCIFIKLLIQIKDPILQKN